MSITVSPEEMVQHYGLTPIPENVRRLGQIIAHQDSTTEEISKLIAQDEGLTAKLLRAANPKAEGEADYAVTSVEGALQRTGIGSALMLAMADPLQCAVRKTFLIMLSLDLHSVIGAETPAIYGEHVLGQVAFTGNTNGEACLRLAPACAQIVAARMLGMSAGDLGSPAEVDDVFAELTNIVVGNFHTNLCDAGLSCKLSPPRISRTTDFRLRPAAGGLVERMGFHATDIDLVVDIRINPWAG